MTTPVDVTLTVSMTGPVGCLTFFGAVGPLFASTTQFSGKSTHFETVGTAPNNRIFFLKKKLQYCYYPTLYRYRILTDTTLYNYLGFTLHCQFSSDARLIMMLQQLKGNVDKEIMMISKVRFLFQSVHVVYGMDDVERK